jgi:hypothetical protein
MATAPTPTATDNIADKEASVPIPDTEWSNKFMELDVGLTHLTPGLILVRGLKKDGKWVFIKRLEDERAEVEISNADQYKKLLVSFMAQNLNHGTPITAKMFGRMLVKNVPVSGSEMRFSEKQTSEVGLYRMAWERI